MADPLIGVRGSTYRRTPGPVVPHPCTGGCPSHCPKGQAELLYDVPAASILLMLGRSTAGATDDEPVRYAHPRDCPNCKGAATIMCASCGGDGCDEYPCRNRGMWDCVFTQPVPLAAL